MMNIPGYGMKMDLNRLIINVKVKNCRGINYFSAAGREETGMPSSPEIRVERGEGAYYLFTLTRAFS